MVGVSNKKADRLLTQVELEMMNVIWELGECTVKDVQVKLANERDLAYTSVATMMKILEQKGILKGIKQDRAHTYRPKLSRADYETLTLKHLATNVFRGDPTSMVMRLLDEANISHEEMQSIRAILNERLKP